jgi:hypothetical protein
MKLTRLEVWNYKSIEECHGGKAIMLDGLDCLVQ